MISLDFNPEHIWLWPGRNRGTFALALGVRPICVHSCHPSSSHLHMSSVCPFCTRITPGHSSNFNTSATFLGKLFLILPNLIISFQMTVSSGFIVIVNFIVLCDCLIVFPAPHSKCSHRDLGVFLFLLIIFFSCHWV